MVWFNESGCVCADEGVEGKTCCMLGLHQNHRRSALPSILGFPVRHYGPIPEERSNMALCIGN